MAREPYEYGVKVGTIVKEIDTHLETLQRQLSTKLTQPEEERLRKALDDLKVVRGNVAEQLREYFPDECAPGEYQPPPPTKR